MKTAKMVFNQISNLTSDLVGTALCNDQNFPIHIGQSWDNCQIEIPNINVSAALKHKPYRELFYELERARSFNLKLLDGALIQLQYKFKDNLLTGHRLGFFPNPDLTSFRETQKSIWMMKSILTSPIPGLLLLRYGSIMTIVRKL